MEAYGLGPKAGPVYEELRRRILSGDYPFGTRLPPHQELASQFGVASLTMRQALAFLEREGLVSREPGRGTFVRDRRSSPRRRARELAASHASEGVLVFGSDGVIQAATPGAAGLLGADPERLVGSGTFSSGVPGVLNDSNRYQADIEPIALAISSRRPVRDVAVRVRRRPDEDWSWLSFNAYPQLDTDGTVTQIICTIDPLTAAARDEQAAANLAHLAGSPDTEYARKDAGRILKSVLDASPVPMLTLDRSGRVTSWGAGAQRVFGFTEQDVLGRRYPLVPPERELEFQHLLTRLRNGETIVGFESQRVLRDGTYLDVSIHISPLLESEKVVGGLAVLTDISERKRTERSLREVNDRLVNVVNNTNDLIFTIDLQGNFTSFNRAAEIASGYNRSDIPHLNFQQILPREFTEQVRYMIAQKLRDRLPTRYEIDMISRDGKRIPLELNTQLILEDGVPVGIQGIARDITERRRAEDALRESEVRYRSLVENAQDIVYLLDRHGHFIMLNPAAERILGYTIQELADRDLFSLVVPQNRDLARGMYESKLSNGRPTSFQIDVMTRGGTLVTLDVSSRTLRGRDGELLVQGIARDITERRTYEERLIHQALHDSLTDLPNRDNLYEQIGLAVSALQANGTLALLVMDFDRFRDLNDTLGHGYGDAVIQEMGRRLERVCDGQGVVARLGGDEFAMLLPGAGPEEARDIAQQTLDSLQELVDIGEQSVFLNISIGIVHAPEHGEDAATLLRKAEVAMYAAKQAQRGVEVYAGHLDPYAPDHLRFITELRQAILRGELLLHFQPQVRLDTGEVKGAEALVRWDHPTQGLLPPDQFVTLAERTGLIRPLTFWVLGEALEECRRWRESGITWRVAVNLSAHLLHDTALVDTVVEAVAAHGLTPNDLTLEITESALMFHPEQSLRSLSRLQSQGVRIALDDFGTGYSSLQYLSQFPLDEIKIAPSFILSLDDPSNEAIVRSIIDLSRRLDLPVVAEGVENEAVLARLRDMGCLVAQGYHFCRPMPSTDLLTLMRETR